MRPSPSPAGQLRVPKTAELVAGHIRRRIVRGELAEDQALPPETALMEEFEISRPTLREAFRILESEGLITIRRGSRGGARVQVPTTEVAARYAGLVLQHREATLADVLEARVIVEAPAAGIVARRRDHAGSARQLRAWLEETGEYADDPDTFSARFHEFNRLLVRLTRNETLILLTVMLEAISDAAQQSYLQTPHETDEILGRRVTRTRHRLVDLIEAGDAEGAEDLWRRHLTDAGKLLAGEGGARVVDLLT